MIKKILKQVVKITKGRSPLVKTLQNAKGMTFVEIMVVVTILAVLATIIGVGAMRLAESSRVNTAKTQIATFINAISHYKIELGYYPEKLEDLIAPPGGGKPFLNSRRLPKDPWGEEYIMKKVDDDIIVVSKGPNKQEGDEDDISSDKM